MSSGGKTVQVGEVLSKILEKVEGVKSLENLVAENAKENRIANAELSVKLDQILTLLATLSEGKSKPKSTVSKGNVTVTTTIPSDKKGPTNSLYWFKMIYKQSRDETLNKYFTEDIRKALDEYMNTNETAKNKKDIAKLDEEINYLVNNHIKSKANIKSKITNDYNQYTESLNKNNITSASKDSNTKDKESEKSGTKSTSDDK